MKDTYKLPQTNKPSTKIKIRLFWKDSLTNKEGTYDTEVPTDEMGVPDMFMWNDGDYSCDCNRSIFFYGLDPTEEGLYYECGEKYLNIYKVAVLD